MESSVITTKGIILWHTQVRSSSLKIILHTLHSGRTVLFAKGFFNSKKNTGILISPGVEAEVVFLKKGAGDDGYLQEISAISMPDVSSAVELVVLHHFLEFLLNIRTESEKEHSAIYKLYLSFIKGMDYARAGTEKLYSMLIAHELLCLKILSFISSPEECPECSASLKGKKEIFFSVKENSFLCKECSSGKNNIMLDEKIFAFLLQVLSEKMTPTEIKKIITSASLGPPRISRLLDVLSHIFENLFGHSLKSDRILKQMMKK
jgi:DNA repair protein RecO